MKYMKPLLLTVLLSTVAVTVLANVALRSTSTSSAAMTTSAPEMAEVSRARPAPAVAGTTPQRLEVEIVTLKAGGFEPAELRRPQGRFILGVDNRTGLDEVELRLESENGARLPALGARRRKLSWRDSVHPPPGRYVISEASHPEWSEVGRQKWTP